MILTSIMQKIIAFIELFIDVDADDKIDEKFK